MVQLDIQRRLNDRLSFSTAEEYEQTLAREEIPFVKPEALPLTIAQSKRRLSGPSGSGATNFLMSGRTVGVLVSMDAEESSVAAPPAKKIRANTPWTPAEEQRMKAMRDAGTSWADIAKTFPSRTEGSVKKHWYKDMHYAEFAEDESQALLNAIKEYEANKWKVIGAKVGKPAKACEQYAKEHFGDKV